VPAPVPGLGEAMRRSGLPDGQDPAAVEAALTRSGLPGDEVVLDATPRCIAGNCGRPRATGRVWCEEHARTLDAER
jgi:hypothetical protein